MLYEWYNAKRPCNSTGLSFKPDSTSINIFTGISKQGRGRLRQHSQRHDREHSTGKNLSYSAQI